MEYRIEGDKTEKLVGICRQAGATGYLSGPAAEGYINEETFRREGIALKFMDYTGYPEYRQLFPPFDHAVSVIDLLFNEGPSAPAFMKSFAPTRESLDSNAVRAGGSGAAPSAQSERAL
jgi:hypothetical protein